MAMAFVDVLRTEMPDMTIFMVDTRARAGGHWQDSKCEYFKKPPTRADSPYWNVVAYDFCRLHQPACCYGVPSKRLGNGGCELSTRHEVAAYFEEIMKEFVASGKVTHFHSSTFDFERMPDPSKNRAKYHFTDSEGQAKTVVVKRKLVNAAYLTAKTPSQVAPKFEVSDKVKLVPVNALIDAVQLSEEYEHFTVLGAVGHMLVLLLLLALFCVCLHS